MEPTFLNRTQEFGELKKIMTLKAESNTGKVLILYSKAGIGKARLIKEYLWQYHPVSLVMNVKNPTSPNSITPSYSYFNMLFKQMECLLEPTPPYALVATIGLSLKQFSFGASVERISDMPKDITRKFKRMHKFFKNYSQKVIVTIENVQVIDHESLEIFKSFLEEFPNIYMFLEYNTDEQHTNIDLLTIFEFLEPFSIYKYPVKIEKLDNTHLLNIMRELKGENIEKSKFEQFYTLYDGNIDKLIISFLEDTEVLSLEPWEILVQKRISKQAQFVLYIVLFYRGEIYKEELLRVLLCSDELYFWSSQRIDSACMELEQSNLIIKEQNRVLLNNSTISILENMRFTEVAYSAFKIVENDSYRLLSDKEKKVTALYQLIYLYSLFKDKQIITLLPHIKECLLTSCSLTRILEYIEKISKHFDFNTPFRNQLKLGIVDILYAVGEMELALEKLEEIFCADNLQHEMYLIAIKGALHTVDFELYYKEVKKKYSDLLRVQLFCDYIYLYYKMKYKNTKVAEEYSEQILKNSKYKMFPEYYFVLKNHSTYLNNKEAINELRECITAFEQNGRKDLIIRTKVTLAMRYANLGDLDQASEILKEAKKDNTYECRECYFLNNFAVIDILNNHFSKEVELNLKCALLFHPSHYQKGIILCNLLIYYCKVQNFKSAANIVRELESPQYLQYAFIQYKHIIHYNLYYYFSCIKDTEKSNYHQLELRNLYHDATIELREYMDATIFNKKKLPESHRRYFYSKLPYRPDYIGYWQLEVPDFSTYYR